jgi:hypothetical protein
VTESKFLRPVEGISLPLADGRPWPAEGALVEVDQYVRRRIADGDVIPATPPGAATESADDVASSKKGK